MSARAISEARAVKHENSSNMVYRKKKVSFSDIINVKILYPDAEAPPGAESHPDAESHPGADDVDNSDSLTAEHLPIIARDIKKTPLKVENTSDTVYCSDVSTYHGNPVQFARNLVDVILKRTNSCQIETVYLP